MTINPYIRTLIRRDLLPVLAIEQANNRDPWTEKDFIRFFSRAKREGNHGVVAEYREQVLGFMLYQVISGGQVVLVELSVHPDFKRRGVATALLDCLIGESVANEYERVSYFSLETNLTSQLFLRSQDFLAVRVHRKYYDECDEDVYEMELELNVPSKV